VCRRGGGEGGGRGIRCASWGLYLCLVGFLLLVGVEGR
jgi:hypothetical protein